MRIAGLSCLLVFAALPLAAAADAQERTVAAGINIDWSYAANKQPVRYRSGPFTLTISGAPSGDPPDLNLYHPVLRVEMPGFAPVEAIGSDTSATFEHRITVGAWDASRHFVLFQSFSGGAHCCNAIAMVFPEQGRLRVIQVGVWDGDYLDELPRDVDGDGRRDFVFPDNRFLYAFAPYAGSHAPSQIWNIEGGRALDVSAAPRYRALFVREMGEFREGCRTSEPENNSACAAYVAAAARAGRFDRAWREMLRVHDRHSQWSLPPGCRIEVAFGACPQDQWIENRDFPTALRDFLRRAGYLPR